MTLPPTGSLTQDQHLEQYFHCVYSLCSYRIDCIDVLSMLLIYFTQKVVFSSFNMQADWKIIPYMCFTNGGNIHFMQFYTLISHIIVVDRGQDGHFTGLQLCSKLPCTASSDTCDHRPAFHFSHTDPSPPGRSAYFTATTWPNNVTHLSEVMNKCKSQQSQFRAHYKLLCSVYVCNKTWSSDNTGA